MAGTLLFDIAMSIIRGQTSTKELDMVIHTEATLLSYVLLITSLSNFSNDKRLVVGVGVMESEICTSYLRLVSALKYVE